MENQDILNVLNNLVSGINIARQITPDAEVHRAFVDGSQYSGYAVYQNQPGVNFVCWFEINNNQTDNTVRMKVTSTGLTEAEFNEELRAITLSGGN